jgi:hypothetical protein
MRSGTPHQVGGGPGASNWSGAVCVIRTPHVGRFEPVIIVFIVVAPVDTAHRYHFAGTEMLSCLNHEQAVPGKITTQSRGWAAPLEWVPNMRRESHSHGKFVLPATPRKW